MIYALDTNIVIHLLRNDIKVKCKFNNTVENGAAIIIPAFVNYEMRRGFHYRPAPAKEMLYNELCSHFAVGEMTLTVWEYAARLYANLRKAGFTVEDADILIAAFCIVNDCTLVTNNIKHFKDINGLSYINWNE